MITIHDCVQGEAAWFEVRRGLPTASMFSAILAKGEGKTRRAYMNKLAAEIITGEVGEQFTSPILERGKQMEQEARDFYAFLHDAPLRQVGFVSNEIAGWSPDSLIGDSGALEIKTQRADLLIETLLKDEVPPEHKAQLQGGLWVGEREWIDLIVYWPKMPPLIKRVKRDADYILKLEHEVEMFREDLEDLVRNIRRRAA